MRAIHRILANSAEYDLLRYSSSWRTLEFLITVAIPAIGNGCPKFSFIIASACELKGAVSRVVEVEWVKFSRYFLRDRAIFKQAQHLTGLNRHLVHIGAHFKHENACRLQNQVLTDRQTDRQTDKLTTNPLAHVC